MDEAFKNNISLLVRNVLVRRSKCAHGLAKMPEAERLKSLDESDRKATS